MNVEPSHEFSYPTFHTQGESIIIILDPDERRRRTMTVRSNDTLVDTPFQLISGLILHVNQGVLCCAGVCWRGGGATGLLNKGGREQQASWFSKQQAVEFPQVLTSQLNLHMAMIPICTQWSCTVSHTICYSLYTQIYSIAGCPAINMHSLSRMVLIIVAIPPLLPNMKPKSLCCSFSGRLAIGRC